jgi:hypothetical protein
VAGSAAVAGNGGVGPVERRSSTQSTGFPIFCAAPMWAVQVIGLLGAGIALGWPAVLTVAVRPDPPVRQDHQ